MDWIFENFQIVALIGLALASLAKRFLDNKSAERQPQEPMEPEEDIFGSLRRWLPQQSEPVASGPPPLVQSSNPPRQQNLQVRLRKIRATKTTPKTTITGGAAATSARVAAVQSHAKPLSTAKAGLRGTLRNPKEIRRAIVMREILGPPISLR